METLREKTLERIKRSQRYRDPRHLAKDVPSVLWQDRDFVLSLFDDRIESRRVCLSVLQLISKGLRADGEFMFAIIRKHDSAAPLQYASKELLENPGFMLRAVAQNYPSSIDYASTLKANHDFGLSAVSKNGRCIEYLDKSLRADKEIALAAVTQGGYNIQYVDESLHADKEIALAAVTQYGLSIRFLPKSLRADKDIALAAVQQAASSIRYVDESRRADREIALAVIKQWGPGIQYMGESLQADKEVAMAAVAQDGSSIRYVAESLRADREIAVTAVAQWGRSLQYVSDSFRADREIAMIAISQDRAAARWVGNALKNDHVVFAHVVFASPGELWNAPRVIQDDIATITKDFSTLEQVQAFIQETKVTRAAFMAFLDCIHTGSVQHYPCCYISAKEKGDDTSLALQQHIAGYAGFPFHDTLARFWTIERTAPILEEYCAAREPPPFQENWNGLSKAFFSSLR